MLLNITAVAVQQSCELEHFACFLPGDSVPSPVSVRPAPMWSMRSAWSLCSTGAQRPLPAVQAQWYVCVVLAVECVVRQDKDGSHVMYARMYTYVHIVHSTNSVHVRT